MPGDEDETTGIREPVVSPIAPASPLDWRDGVGETENIGACLLRRDSVTAPKGGGANNNPTIRLRVASTRMTSKADTHKKRCGIEARLVGGLGAEVGAVGGREERVGRGDGDRGEEGEDETAVCVKPFTSLFNLALHHNR